MGALPQEVNVQSRGPGGSPVRAGSAGKAPQDSRPGGRGRATVSVCGHGRRPAGEGARRWSIGTRRLSHRDGSRDRRPGPILVGNGTPLPLHCGSQARRFVMKKALGTVALAAAALALLAAPAAADMALQKKAKDLKLAAVQNCQSCHVDKMPKKGAFAVN